MYSVYFNCGTSNTRIYLVKDMRLIDNNYISIGIKDSALAKNNNVLLSNLKQSYDAIIKKNALNDTEINYIWASGMVTNPFGIKEVDKFESRVVAIFSKFFSKGEKDAETV